MAHIYRFGLAVAYTPTKAVEEVFGVSRPTAGRWVSAARRKGSLGPAEAGKAGWSTEEDALLAEVTARLDAAHTQHVAAVAAAEQANLDAMDARRVSEHAAMAAAKADELAERAAREADNANRMRLEAAEAYDAAVRAAAEAAATANEEEDG